MPGEYAAIGQPLGPQPFSLTDLIRIATLVGGIFGNGGGDQLNNALLYENLANKFGAERAAVAGLPALRGRQRGRRSPAGARSIQEAAVKGPRQVRVRHVPELRRPQRP